MFIFIIMAYYTSFLIAKIFIYLFQYVYNFDFFYTRIIELGKRDSIGDMNQEISICGTEN